MSIRRSIFLERLLYLYLGAGFLPALLMTVRGLFHQVNNGLYLLVGIIAAIAGYLVIGHVKRLARFVDGSQYFMIGLGLSILVAMLLIMLDEHALAINRPFVFLLFAMAVSDFFGTLFVFAQTRRR